MILHGGEINAASLTGMLDWLEQQPDVKQVERFGDDFVFELKQGL